jgi:UDP-N-acetylglucosamine:LPS N-acetylglucosamine transferase
MISAEKGRLQATADQARVDVLLVCSSGGHLLQLVALDPAWRGFRHAWVTHERSDSRSLLKGERVYYGYMPTTRSLKNFVRNIWLASRILRLTQPRVVLTTGAALAVPFAWLARLRRIDVVYVESFARIEAPSLSCKLVRRAANRVYVQWPELLPQVPDSRYIGSVFSRS